MTIMKALHACMEYINFKDMENKKRGEREREGRREE